MQWTKFFLFFFIENNKITKALFEGMAFANKEEMLGNKKKIKNENMLKSHAENIVKKLISSKLS